MSLGKRLQAARNAKKMSRNELAVKLSRSIHTIKSWELDRHAPAAAMQRKIEIIFNKPEGYFSQHKEDRRCAVIKTLAQHVKALPSKKQEYALKALEYFSKTIS